MNDSPQQVVYENVRVHLPNEKDRNMKRMFVGKSRKNALDLNLITEMTTTKLYKEIPKN